MKLLYSSELWSMSFGNDVEIVRMTMMMLLLPVTLVVENEISSLDLNDIAKKKKNKEEDRVSCYSFLFCSNVFVGCEYEWSGV